MKSEFDFQNREQYEKYLRSYFAGFMLQGILSNKSNDYHEDAIKAEYAVKIADELIKQLNKPKP